jgi:transposase
MAKTGSPYKYDPKYHDAWAFSLAIKGATDEEIATAFGVARRTILRWQKTKNDKGEEVLTSFGEAIRTGKEQADAQVEKKLYERCIGYETTEVHQTLEHDKEGRVSIKETKTTKKQVAPDVMAIMYWLNNRSKKSGDWSQRQDINVSFEDEKQDVVIYLPENGRDINE